MVLGNHLYLFSLMQLLTGAPDIAQTGIAGHFLLIPPLQLVNDREILALYIPSRAPAKR